MQRMDSLDTSKHKAAFKKQNHRPWAPLIQKDTPALFENDRLLIGGFSFPAVSAMPYELEQKQKLNIQKEALARQAAEKKALHATEQLHMTESELQKTKQQLQLEQQLKTKEAAIKQSLETEIKNALRAIDENEHAIAHETQARKSAEKRINDMLSLFTEKEQSIRLQAEKTINDSLRNFIQKEKNLEKTFENRITTLEAAHKKQILNIQAERNQKIAEAERKIRLYEEAKIEAQAWIQKSEEASRLMAIEKTELENNLAATFQDAIAEKTQHESIIRNLREQARQSEEKISSMAILNVELKQQLSETYSKLDALHQTESETAKHIEALNLQIQQLKEKSIVLENDKNELTKLFTDSLGKSKILKSITNHERQLRVLLEEKLSGKELEKMNYNKKLFEKKIIELSEKISALELEKAKIQENYNSILDNAHKAETLLADEKTATKILEEKNNLLAEQIHNLEHANQKENYEKEVAIHKNSELVIKQQYLEEEKINLEQKNNLLTEQIQNLEYAKQQENHEKEIAIHKISELVSKQQNLEQETINIEAKNNLLTEQIRNLEHANQKESHEKEIATHQVSELFIKQQHLEQEKKNLEEIYNQLATNAIELKIALASEQSLRKEAENLRMIEAEKNQVAQQKMSAALEQANNTLATVLDQHTKTKEKNKLLIEQLYCLEHANQKAAHEQETATHKVSELVAYQQHLEKEKIDLEAKNNLLTEQIHNLAHDKQKEINEKEIATYQISELLTKQQYLEQEKINLEEKYNALESRTAELKIILESEKCLRREAEKSKAIEENARKAAQAKISSAMEQANKTVLTILGNYTTAEVLAD